MKQVYNNRLAIMGILGVSMGGITSQAAVVLTDRASFDSLLAAGAYVEEFSDLPPNGHDVNALTGQPDPLNLSQNGFSYTITTANTFGSPSLASIGNLWRNEVDTTYGNWLSTTDPGDVVTITFTGAPVTAVGGTFFLTGDVAPTFEGARAGNLTLTLGDGTTRILASQNSGAQPFLGFIATGGETITSLTLTPPPIGLNDYFFASFDKLTVGTAVVPEPMETSMIIGGILVAYGVFRRTRSRATA